MEYHEYLIEITLKLSNGVKNTILMIGKGITSQDAVDRAVSAAPLFMFPYIKGAQALHLPS